MRRTADKVVREREREGERERERIHRKVSTCCLHTYTHTYTQVKTYTQMKRLTFEIMVSDMVITLHVTCGMWHVCVYVSLSLSLSLCVCVCVCVCVTHMICDMRHATLGGGRGAHLGAISLC